MELRQQLQEEFGDSLATREAGHEDAVDGVVPQAVAMPHDEAAAQALVAWCGRQGVRFIARGCGTKLHIGARPQQYDLLISIEKLDKVIEHDEGNATISAQAGITLEALNEVVGQHNQFVPLEGADASNRATLGGIVATNYYGMSRLKYTTPRDLVVGLHAVLSDGRLIKAGSKVVKNVSGYDLNKIFTGSYGSLGLITEVTVRLRPNNAATATWHGNYSSWQEVAEQARFIFDGPFEPTALRVSAYPGRFHLMARFDGGETAVQTQMDRLPSSAASETSTNAINTDIAVQVRAVLPLQKVFQWAQQAQALGAEQVLWDYGTGLVQATFTQAPDNIDLLIASLRIQAEAANGFLVAERVPVELKSADLVWGKPRSDFALMKSLKDTYDSAHVCSPGRFIGGL